MTTNRKKLVIGGLTVLAVGIGIGVALSKGELIDELLDTFKESGGKFVDNLKDLYEDNKSVLSDIKDQLASRIPSDLPGPSA